MKKFYCLRFLLVLLFCICSAAIVSADQRAEYERYVAAYNAYQNAVTEKRPVAEIMQLLESYQRAKSVYEGSLNKETSKPTDIAGANTTTNTQQLSAQAPETAEAVANAEQQLPTGLKRILEQLWSEKGRQNPDQAMKLLETYAKSASNHKLADVARYELAKAYELLKEDEAKSAEILGEIGRNDPNSKMAALARERINYLAAGQKHKNWKQTLNNSYAVSQESYHKYRATSWFAFPVKATRWVDYAGKLFNFSNNQNDFRKFQLWYEEMGSRFAPPVEITFDSFKVAIGDSNELSEVSLFYSNSQSWYARWKAMEEARHSIDVQYYIVTKDVFGYSMLGSLLKKAKEGLKIRLLVDARGTKDLSRKLLGQDLLQELVTFPNVEVKVFNPIHTNLLTVFKDPRKLIASNHDKIIVVDNEISIIGGRNVSMDYYLEPEDHKGAYRDSDVVIRSREIANQLSYAFGEEFAKLKTYKIGHELWGNIDVMSDYLTSAYDVMFSHMLNERFTIPTSANRKYTRAAQSYLTEMAGYNNLRSYTGFDMFASAITAPTKIIDKHSIGGPRDDITDQIIRYIDGCRTEVLMQNPYVVLTDRMFNALKRAGKRGVPVILHTNSPASTDSLLTQAMFYADWKRIFKEIPNIRIFVYAGGNKLHCKNWVFDKKIGVVGTYNLDYLSEEINSEVVAAVKSKEFAQQLRDEIFQDIKISTEYKVNINNKGEVEAITGPDDLPGKNFWLLKFMSKLNFMKRVI